MQSRKSRMASKVRLLTAGLVMRIGAQSSKPRDGAMVVESWAQRLLALAPGGFYAARQDALGQTA